MKTKNQKTFIVSILVAVMLTMLTKQASAGNYTTIYMDSVKQMDNLNQVDTVSACSSFETIKVVPMKGLSNIFWPQFIQGVGGDTTYADTLYLQSSFNGMLNCEGNKGGIMESKGVYIRPLSFSGKDKEISCGDKAILSTSTNYTGNGGLQYNWAPATGLDNPKIPGPVAIIKNNIMYTVTMTTPDGCIVTANVSVSMKPMDSPAICIVSIDSTTNKNIIYWEKPVSTAIDSFYIFRETNVTNVFNKIGAVNYNDNSVFIDTASLPNVQSNKYEISIKDSCGFESAKSAPHKTMHLSIGQGLNSSWNLIWEPYEGFNVSTYNIYRGTNLKNLQLTGTTSASSTQYTDFSTPSGRVFYQVEVVSPNTCGLSATSTNLKSSPTSVNTSRSNIVTNGPTAVSGVSGGAALFAVYPNPVVDNLFIGAGQTGLMGCNVEISDIEGRILKTVSLKPSNMEINVSDLNSGFYIISIKTGTGAATRTIVKK